MKFIKDKNLSWKAKGVYAALLCYKKEIDANGYTMKKLNSLAKEGIAATQGAVKELEAQGYIAKRMQHANGKFVSSKWTFLKD